MGSNPLEVNLSYIIEFQMNYLKKIISADQIKQADQQTIKNEPISSIDLMERASNTFVSAIENRLDANQSIAVICGTGNNGGDGLAIARILMWKGYDVQPFLFLVSDKLSADCESNNQKIDNILTVNQNSEMPNFGDFDVIIDGLFGSGLNREIEGWAGEIVDQINDSSATVISIDIPSGMYCDDIPEGDHIVNADLVISFQRPKKSFFLPESSKYILEWEIVDIGLDENYIQFLEGDFYLLDDSIAKSLKKREKYSHKGTFGHALIVAGARGRMGAAILCAKGCLRSGAGLVTIHTPGCGLDILQISIPESMCSVDPHEYHFTTLPDLSPYDSVGIGPGLGQAKETKEALAHLLNTSTIPLVLDADALNILSHDQTLQALIPDDTILTPHPKEFQRLVGDWKHSLERLEKQIAFSKLHRCIIVLKDADTVITDAEGNVYFNTSGNPGMATGGSGDVLTGIISGLVAQRYTPLEAALIGVYYHGLAGDVACRQRGMNALIASDIVQYLRIDS